MPSVDFDNFDNFNNFDQVVNRSHTQSVKWDTMTTFNVGGSQVGRGVLPFWVADMDFMSCDTLVENLEKTARSGIFGYVDVPKVSKQLTVEWLSKVHQWKVDPDHIDFSNGVMNSLIATLLALTQEGDEVLLCQPIYGPMFHIVKTFNRKLLVHELDMSGDQFELDFEKLESQITPKTKLLFWCHPHNPSGRVWSQDELERIATLCLKYNLILCSNEIHSDITYPEHKHIPMASLSKEVANHTITFHSPSKTFNLGGMKISYFVISNPNLYKKVSQVNQTLSASHPFTNFGITAFNTVYHSGFEWYQALLKYLKGNRDYVIDFISQLPVLRVIKPQATFLAWIDCSRLHCKEVELQEMFVRQAKVFLSNGSYFGSHGEGYMRLNFACPRSILEKGLTHIKQALEPHLASQQL